MQFDHLSDGGARRNPGHAGLLFACKTDALIAVTHRSGLFLGNYLKKKGENLATHEDIDKLVDQVKAVTQATKESETKISNDVWDRQKRWEMKKDVLFEASRRISEFDDALMALDTVFKEERKFANHETDSSFAAAKHDRVLRWRNAAAAFDESRFFVGILCSPETFKAFEGLAIRAQGTAENITTMNRQSCRRDTRGDLFASIVSARNAIRKELGIEPLFKPQSNVSSAAPSPDSQAPGAAAPTRH